MVSPYLNYPLRSQEEARRDSINDRLRWETSRLRNLPLTDPKRGECIRTIRALEAELDGLDDTVAT